MKFKRFLSLTLSVLLVLSAVPAASLFIGAASATYDIADSFDGANSATVNGETKSAADVFELKTMVEDGTVSDFDYAAAGTSSIADYISDGGLAVPHSVAADAKTGTPASVNFVQLKDSVASGRTLNSYYIDIDADNAQINRTASGQGFAFAYDSSAASYKIVQYAKARSDLPMQVNLYTISKTVYTGNKNGWANVGAASDLTAGTTYYYRIKITYTYSSDKISKVNVNTAIYSSDEDRTNGENAVATASSDLGLGSYSNYLTADMSPLFAFASGNNSSNTNVIKNVVLSYSKTSEEIAAEEAAENKAASDKFVADYAELLDTDVTEDNAQQFVDAYTAFNALSDGAKALLENYEGTNYAALVVNKYAVAVPLLPTEASTAFKTYYAENVAALTSAEGKLDVLNTAIVKYNAVEDTHKAQFADAYKHITDLLDGYFINGNTVTYSMTDEDKANYPEVYSYFKNTIMTTADTNGTAKHVAFDKFNSRRLTSATVAFKYNDDCVQGLGFGFIPEDIVIPEGVTTTNNRDYFVTSITRAKYPNTSDNLYFYSACNYLKNDNASAATTLVTKFSSALGNNFWTYNDAVLKNTDNIELVSGTAATYKVKGDRIVFKLTFDTGLTTENGYSAVRATPTSYLCFIDKNGNNEYDEGTDLKLLSFTQLKNEGVFYKYANAEAPLPYIQLVNDASIDNLLYFSTESEDSFADRYADVLNSETPDADATLAMYAAYNALSDSEKALENVDAAVEAAVTKAGLRPETNGATLRADGTMNIGFYGKAPTAKVTNGYVSRFGILVAGYQNMVDAGVKELKLGDTTQGSTVNAVTYNEGDTVASDILLALNGISVTDTKTWSTKIVARVFVEYTVNGAVVPVYSVNADNGKAKPTSIDGIDNNGVCIRNVNSLLKAIAANVYNNSGAMGDTEGVKVGDDTTYVGKKLSENTDMLNAIKGKILDGDSSVTLDQIELFKFLCAYRSAIKEA